MRLRQRHQPAADAQIVRSPAVLGADADGVLVALQAFAQRAHVHRDQLGHVVGDAGGRAVTNFLEVAEVERRALRRHQPAFRQGSQRSQHDRHAGLVVQVPRFDVTRVGDDRAGIPGDQVADLDAQGARFSGGSGPVVQADLHLVGLPLFIAHRFAVDVTEDFTSSAVPVWVWPSAVLTQQYSPLTAKSG